MRNYPTYGMILCGAVLFLLLVYNICFYAIPTEKLVDTRQSWILKGSISHSHSAGSRCHPSCSPMATPMTGSWSPASWLA